MNDKVPHIVVLGAGFGGLTFCQTFRNPQARVTLVDRQNHHLFQPLLYQVATAGLSAPEIAQPARSILRDLPNVSPLTRSIGVETDRAGRLKVLPDLSLPGHPEVFAIGDLALVLQEDGKPVPGVSPAAIQEAQHVAKLIRDGLVGPVTEKVPRPAFKYWDKGTMATIGRSAAVAEIGSIRFSGFVAWLAWLFVHIIFLVGFRNQLAVLLQWFYSYCTYRRGARIVTGVSPQDSKGT